MLRDARLLFEEEDRYVEPANDMSMAAQEADVSVDTQKHELSQEFLQAALGKDR